MVQLIHRLFEILFFPIAYFGLGCIYLLIRYHKEHKRELFLLAALLLTMTGWRFFFAQSSTRYWSVILYPALIFAAYFCSWIKNHIKVLRFGFVLVLTCLIKDFDLNKNNQAIQNAAIAIKRDMQTYQSPVCAELQKSGVLTRIESYIGIPTVSFDELAEIQMSHICEPARGLYDVCYVVRTGSNQNDNTDMMTYQSKRIFSQDKDMRKKNKICVYKALIPDKTDSIPIKKELCPNGGFENEGIRNGKPFPVSWGESGSVDYSSDVVISGEKSIFIKGESSSLLYSAPIPPLSENGFLLFTVKNAKGASIGLYVFGFDETNKRIFIVPMMKTFVNSDTLHQFSIPYNHSCFKDADTVRYYWYIYAPNGLYIDDIGFTF